MLETRVPAHQCACGAEPSPGDISICWHCGNIAAFGPDLRLVPVDLADVEPMERARIKRVQAEIIVRRPS